MRQHDTIIAKPSQAKLTGSVLGVLGVLSVFWFFLRALSTRQCALSCLLALFAGSASLAVAENLSGEPRHGLERLIQQAILNHPDIAAARAERRASEFDIDAARNRFYPSPAVQLREDRDGTATVVSLTQPLWSGGRLTAGLDAAHSRSDSAAIAINEARYTLALRVVDAWAAYRQALGRATAYAENLNLLQIYSESVGRRIVGGASAEVDRELVAARLAQAQSDLAAARSAQRVAVAQLARLLGQPLRAEDMETAPAQAADDGSGERLPPIDEFLRLAVDYSPALRRFDADIEAARHDVEQQQAILWPTVNLRAEHQRSDAATSVVVKDSRIMLTLDYAPDAGLSTGASANAAQTRIITRQEKREAARRDLADTIQNDYETYRASREQTRSLKRTLDANTAVLASYDRLLIAGKRSWLDVLNIARELTVARTALADSETQAVAARTRLRLHTGDLPGISIYQPS